MLSVVLQCRTCLSFEVMLPLCPATAATACPRPAQRLCRQRAQLRAGVLLCPLPRPPCARRRCRRCRLPRPACAAACSAGAACRACAWLLGARASAAVPRRQQRRRRPTRASRCSQPASGRRAQQRPRPARWRVWVISGPCLIPTRVRSRWTAGSLLNTLLALLWCRCGGPAHGHGRQAQSPQPQDQHALLTPSRCTLLPRGTLRTVH